MDEYWNEALNEISDKYIEEAIRPKRKKFPWFGAVAATAAAAMLVVLISPLALMAMFLGGGGMASADPGDSFSRAPVSESAQPVQKPIVPNWDDTLPLAGLLSSPEYPEMVPYPNDAINTNENQDKYRAWRSALTAQYDQPKDYDAGLSDFFLRAIPQLVTDDGENAVCSPLNIYMTLAMLTETTGGNSRADLLKALNAESIESLRTQAGHVWNAHYRSDGAAACLLANSLWLNEGYAFNRNTVDTLAESYYASVFQGDLGSASMNNALRAWLSVQTQGLLDDYIYNVEMSDQDALALASTVFFQGRWSNPFQTSRGTEDVFHSPKGDVDTIFMNDTLAYGPYYYGKDFGAVCLGLDGAGLYSESAMWLILPDEGYDPQDILDSGHALHMILGQTYKERNKTTIKVHLSVPKFDISAETDLREGLTALGLGDLFSESEADFSSILPEAMGAHLGKTTHAARVAIDEEGVTAAAYTVMAANGAPIPPEEEVYFTLDRPFLFVITSNDGLPLFVGIVNEP